MNQWNNCKSSCGGSPATLEGSARNKAPIIKRAAMSAGRYDSAQTTEDNRRHWSNADALSADASANPQVRRTIRNRARYEYSNNCYLKGTADTLANDTIGSGPRLQMLSDDDVFNNLIEEQWLKYCVAIKLDQKLRTARVARVISGESFLVRSRNPGINHGVKMDVAIYEPDQIGGTIQRPLDFLYYDGIRYDEYGNPLSYDVLDTHPGDVAMTLMTPSSYETIAARDVWHYYRPERPGQRRGVPECTAALPFFAHLRNLDLSVVTAMRTAADYAMAIQTKTGLDEGDTGGGSGGGKVGEGDEAGRPEPMDTFELQRGMTTVLPDGYTLSQTKPEQPHQKFNDVEDAMIRGIGRSMNVPFEIIAMDASKANMSAAYLNRQPYVKAIEVERKDLEQMLDWVTEGWFYFLERADVPELADYRGRFPTTKHMWFWDEFVNHADPDKVASAEQTELQNGTTTIPLLQAKRGRDAETVLEQEAKFYRVNKEELRKKKYERQYSTQQPQQTANPQDKNNDKQNESEDASSGAQSE